MVSYDPLTYQQAISGSRGVQSAGRITQPTLIEDEEESQFSFKPAPPSFQPQQRSTLGTVGSGLGKVWSAIDTPIADRLGFKIPEMRGPFDEIGNIVLQEATRPTNLAFAIPGVGAASRGFGLASRLARPGANLLGRAAPRVVKFGTQAMEPLGSWAGSPIYRAAAEVAGAGVIRGASEFAVDQLPENAPLWQKLGVGLGAGLFAGYPAARTLSHLPRRYRTLTDQAKLGNEWANQTKIALRHPSWHMKGDWTSQIDSLVDSIGADRQNYVFGIDPGTGRATLKRDETMQPDIVEAIEDVDRQQIFDWFEYQGFDIRPWEAEHGRFMPDRTFPEQRVGGVPTDTAASGDIQRPVARVGPDRPEDYVDDVTQLDDWDPGRYPTVRPIGVEGPTAKVPIDEILTASEPDVGKMWHVTNNIRGVKQQGLRSSDDLGGVFQTMDDAPQEGVSLFTSEGAANALLKLLRFEKEFVEDVATDEFDRVVGQGEKLVNFFSRNKKGRLHVSDFESLLYQIFRNLDIDHARVPGGGATDWLVIRTDAGSVRDPSYLSGKIISAVAELLSDDTAKYYNSVGRGLDLSEILTDFGRMVQAPSGKGPWRNEKFLKKQIATLVDLHLQQLAARSKSRIVSPTLKEEDIDQALELFLRLFVDKDDAQLLDIVENVVAGIRAHTKAPFVDEGADKLQRLSFRFIEDFVDGMDPMSDDLFFNGQLPFQPLYREGYETMRSYGKNDLGKVPVSVRKDAPIDYGDDVQDFAGLDEIRVAPTDTWVDGQVAPKLPTYQKVVNPSTKRVGASGDRTFQHTNPDTKEIDAALVMDENGNIRDFAIDQEPTKVEIQQKIQIDTDPQTGKPIRRVPEEVAKEFDELPDDAQFGITGYGAGVKLLLQAVENGAKTISLFDGPMIRVAYALGFEPVGYVKYSDAYDDVARQGIDPDIDVLQPDLVTMAYTGGPRVGGTQDGPGRNAGIRYRIDEQRGDLRQATNQFKTVEGATEIANQISTLSDDTGLRFYEFPTRAEISGSAEEIRGIANAANQELVSAEVDELFAGSFGKKYRNNSELMPRDTEKYLDDEFARVRLDPIGNNTVISLPVRGIGTDKGIVKLDDAEWKRFVLDNETGQLYPEDFYLDEGRGGFIEQRLGLSLDPAGRFDRITARQKLGIDYWNQLKSPQEAPLNKFQAAIRSILGGHWGEVYDPDAAVAALQFSNTSDVIQKSGADFKRFVETQLYKSGLNEKIIVQEFAREDGTMIPMLSMNVPEGALRMERVQLPDGNYIDSPVYHLEDFLDDEEIEALREILLGDMQYLRAAETKVLPNAGENVTGLTAAEAADISRQAGANLPESGPVNFWDLMEHSNLQTTADGTAELGVYVPRDFITLGPDDVDFNRGTLQNSQFLTREGRRGILNEVDIDGNRVENPNGFNNNQFQFLIDEIIKLNGNLEFQTDLPTILAARLIAGEQTINAGRFNNVMESFGKNAYQYIQEKHPGLIESKNVYARAITAAQEDINKLKQRRGELVQASKDVNPLINNVYSNLAKIQAHYDQYSEVSAQDLLDIKRDIFRDVKSLAYLSGMLKAQQALGVKLRQKKGVLSRYLDGTIDDAEAQIVRFQEEWDELNPELLDEDSWKGAELSAKEHFDNLYAADQRGVPKSGTKRWDKQTGLINRIDNLVGQIYRVNNQLMREFDRFGVGIPARLNQPLDPSLRSQAWDTDPQIPFAPPRNQEGPGVLDPRWESEGRPPGRPVSPGEPVEPAPPRWTGDEDAGVQAIDAERVREFNALLREEARLMDMSPEEYRALMVNQTNTQTQFTKSQITKLDKASRARKKQMQRIVNEYHDILSAEARSDTYRYLSEKEHPLAFEKTGRYDTRQRTTSEIDTPAGSFDIGPAYSPELRRGRNGVTGRRTQGFLDYLNDRTEQILKQIDLPARPYRYTPPRDLGPHPKMITSIRRMLTESADKIDEADEALRIQGTTYVEAVNSGVVTREDILTKEIDEWMPTREQLEAAIGETYASRILQPVVPEGKLAVQNMFKYLKQMVREYGYLMKEAEKAAQELDEVNRLVDENQLANVFTRVDKDLKYAAIKRKVTASLMQTRHNEGLKVMTRMKRLSTRSDSMAKKVEEKLTERLERYDLELEDADARLKQAQRNLVDAENKYQEEVRRYNGLQDLTDLRGVSSSLDRTVRTLPSVQRQFAATPALQPPEPLFGSFGENWAKINGEMRAASATLDMSATTIQGLFAMGTHPVEAAKAFWMVTGSWLKNPELRLAWYQENREDWLRFMRRGLVLVDPQGNEEWLLQANTPVQKELSKVTDRTAVTRWIASTLGKGRDLSNFHFAEMGNVMRFIMAKKLEQGNFVQKMVAQAEGRPVPKLTEDQWRKQISVINNATGMASNYRPSNLATTALFAPRFFRSQLRMVRDAVFRTDEAGQLARKYMLSTMMTAVMLTTALNEVRGESTEYNLWSVNERTGEAYFNTNALKIKNVGGRDISLLGVYDSLLGLIVSGMVQGPEAAATRTLRSKASPLIGRTWDVISGQDFAGNQVIVEPVKDPIQTIQTAARMAANSYTPFFVGDVAEDIARGTAGAQSPFVMAGAFLGMKASPMTPNERRNYKVQQWVNDLSVEEKESVGLLFRNELNAMQSVPITEYRDLTGAAKTAFDNENPLYDELNLESLEKRAHRGDEAAQAQLNKILIDDIAMEEQEALAEAFVKWRNGEPNYGDQSIPMDISKIMSELTDIRYRSWKAKKTQDRFFDQLTSNPVSDDPIQRALSEYYQALDSSTIPGTNFVQWNDFNRKIAELQRNWTLAQSNAIENRSPARIHPVFQPFWDARTRVNQSGYYDVAQQIYEKPVIQNAITALLGEDIPEYYDSFVTMIEDLFADPDPARQQLAFILSRINGKIVPPIQQSRKALLLQYPQLREDLEMLGRIRPNRQQVMQVA